jgi:HAD superfamily hydrolase (TIGR01509 family)
MPVPVSFPVTRAGYHPPVTIRALIFDFDGLLVDTESAVLRAWQETFTRHGTELPLEAWHAVVGTQHTSTAMLALLGELGIAFDSRELRAELRTRILGLLETEGTRAGVRDYLTEAADRGMKLAVASSSTGEWVRAQLDRVSLFDRFDAVLTGDLHPAKPAPDLYLAALSVLRVEDGDAIAFEDSPHGVTAAKAAGIRCVAVPNAVTARLPFDHADVVLGSFTDKPLSDLLALFE